MTNISMILKKATKKKAKKKCKKKTFTIKQHSTKN